MPANASSLCLIIFLTLISTAATAQATAPAASPYYARNNTFSVFGAYSGDSSHILLGDAENRKLLDFGVAYGRKLFLNRIVNWQYNGELLPVALESDPLTQEVINQTAPTVVTSVNNLGANLISCSTTTTPFNYAGLAGVTYSGTETLSCNGRRWTIGEGMSPAGLQWNFLPRRRLQPFFIGHGGYMYSTQTIPVQEAGSFNFTFDLGAGFELYRSQTRSVRAEYRYHHISNHGTAYENPGIDNGLFQVTYSFGR